MAVSITSASPDVVSPAVFTVLSGTFPLVEGPAFRVTAIDALLAETDMGLHTTYDGLTIAVIYAGPLASGVYTFRVEEDGNPGNNDTISPITVVAGSVSGVSPVTLAEGGGEVVVEGEFEPATDYYARLDPGDIPLSDGNPVTVVDDTLTFTVPADAPAGTYTLTVSVYVDLELVDLSDPQDFEITSGGGGGGGGGNGPGGGCAVDQMMLIRDSRIVGAVVSATSQDGARIGLTVPAATNQGALSPTVTGDPDDLTIDTIGLQVVGGGSFAAGRGSAEWVWEDSDAATWVGAHSEAHAWGHHLPLATNRLGAVVVYSSVYRRVVVIAANHSGGAPTGTITTAWSAVNERPVSTWTDLAYFAPEGDVADGGHALAACETPDGALLLAVKKPVAGVSSDAFSTGDWDLYRSEDGGETWTLARRDILQAANASGAASNGCAKLQASGNWLRFVFVEYLSGSIATVVSADGGATWKALDALVASTDIAAPLTDQDHDVRPFDVVAVDESTGAFLLATDPVGSGPTNRVKLWYATRDGQWESTTIAASESLPDTVRSFVFFRDPCWVWLWIALGDVGSSTGRWTVLRAPRDLVLEPTEWVSMSNPHPRRGATRLLPIQSRAVWCGDRAAMVGYLEDIAEASPPVGRLEARPWLCWIGGWSSRPWGANIDRADGLLESVHWDATQGEPALGATSLTMSQWTHAITGGGTHSWQGGHVLYSVSTTSEYSYSSISIDLAEQQDPPQWDPAGADEVGALASRIFACEWVCAVGATASSAGDNAGVRVWMPVVAGGGSAFRLLVRVGTTNAVVYDEVGAAAVASLAAGATTLASDLWHRFRLVVAPAATASGSPAGVLQYRRDDGDLWSSVAFSVPAAGGAGVTMARFAHGMLGRSASGYAEVGFREFRVSSYWFRPNYADFTAPGDLPGARVALRPRGLTAGSTASDPGLLQVHWGGAGAFVGDSWSHVLGHDYAAEMIGIDSPQFYWRSGAGATAGQSIVYDACRGAAVDDGRRFVHTHSAIFGLHGRRGLIEYADDAAITSNVVGITFDTLQHSGLRASAVSGSVVSIDPASEPADVWREGELAGRLLLVTAGGSALNHVHLVERHHYDGTAHHVVLATGGAFASALIPVGATMSICARSAWVNYGETVQKRYARLTFGLTADEAWDGHWACENWVPGVARYFDPPLAWSHTDMEEPNTVVERARNGQTWAYEEGPAERVWVGRQIGDAVGDRAALRDLLRVLAKYQEEPVALLLNENSTEDQERHLLLTRWDGGSHLDQQAWYHEGPSTISRGAGDQDVQFREIV